MQFVDWVTGKNLGRKGIVMSLMMKPLCSLFVQNNEITICGFQKFCVLACIPLTENPLNLTVSKSYAWIHHYIGCKINNNVMELCLVCPKTNVPTQNLSAEIIVST